MASLTYRDSILMPWWGAVTASARVPASGCGSTPPPCMALSSAASAGSVLLRGGAGSRLKLERSRVTVSDGCAPTASQYLTRGMLRRRCFAPVLSTRGLYVPWHREEGRKRQTMSAVRSRGGERAGGVLLCVLGSDHVLDDLLADMPGAVGDSDAVEGEVDAAVTLQTEPHDHRADAATSHARGQRSSCQESLQLQLGVRAQMQSAWMTRRRGDLW